MIKIVRPEDLLRLNKVVYEEYVNGYTIKIIQISPRKYTVEVIMPSGRLKHKETFLGYKKAFENAEEWHFHLG